MTANVSINFDKEDFEAARRRFEDKRPILTALGLVLLNKSQNAFKKQRFGKSRWRARSVPNVAGIISDLNRGANPPARRFQGRPALVDTGRLRNSIAMKVGTDGVEVGTKVKYAADHEQGKTITIRLTKAGKTNLSRLLAKKTSLRKSLGFLFKKSTIKVKLPKRQIVGADQDDIDRMIKLVETYATGGDV